MLNLLIDFDFVKKKFFQFKLQMINNYCLSVINKQNRLFTLIYTQSRTVPQKSQNVNINESRDTLEQGTIPMN